jgi:Nucleoside-diphosphate-sugar epimerases
MTPPLTVVTGSAGHVGGNLVRALLAEGRKVRALIRNDTRAITGLPLEVVKADLLDPLSLEHAFRGADVVYHLAAQISVTGDQDGLVQAVNVTGTRNVAQAAIQCQVRRLVHFSSIHAFCQHPHDQPLYEDRQHVNTTCCLSYDKSKAMGEAAVLEACAQGLDAVIVNPTSIIGPYDYKPSPMGAALLMLFNREMPALVDGGFDWVDVRDVVKGAMQAEKHGRTGERYLLSGHWHTFAELADIIEKTCGIKRPRLVFPIWLAGIGAPFGELYARLLKRRPLFTRESIQILKDSNRHISHAKARAELGYITRSLHETIADIFDWFKTARMIK